MAGARAATWNVRGALSGGSGKLEAILHWGSQEKVGIIALQEVFATGLTVTGVCDDDGCEWQLCLAGPQAGRKHASTGFLVSESFQLHDFQAGTPRVSTVVVSPRGSQEQVVFVSAYAPTEEKATLEEVLQFYEVLEQAYVMAVAEYGKSNLFLCTLLCLAIQTAIAFLILFFLLSNNALTTPPCGVTKAREHIALSTSSGRSSNSARSVFHVSGSDCPTGKDFTAATATAASVPAQPGGLPVTSLAKQALYFNFFLGLSRTKLRRSTVEVLAFRFLATGKAGCLQNLPWDGGSQVHNTGLWSLPNASAPGTGLHFLIIRELSRGTRIKSLTWDFPVPGCLQVSQFLELTPSDFRPNV